MTAKNIQTGPARATAQEQWQLWQNCVEYLREQAEEGIVDADLLLLQMPTLAAFTAREDEINRALLEVVKQDLALHPEENTDPEMPAKLLILERKFTAGGRKRAEKN